jgi:hypothetical protein
MPDPNDNPPDPQPAADGDFIDARGSQGPIGSAGTVNQHFYNREPAAERVVPTCPPPLAGTLSGRDEVVSELIVRLTGGAEVVAICAALAAFGAAPLDFDWEAMAAVWATGEDETARWRSCTRNDGRAEVAEGRRRLRCLRPSALPRSNRRSPRDQRDRGQDRADAGGLGARNALAE